MTTKMVAIVYSTITFSCEYTPKLSTSGFLANFNNSKSAQCCHITMHEGTICYYEFLFDFISILGIN